jgi:hypothetical protein
MHSVYSQEGPMSGGQKYNNGKEVPHFFWYITLIFIHIRTIDVHAQIYG